MLFAKAKEQEKVPAKFAKRIAAFADPNFPVYPEPTSLLTQTLKEVGRSGYLAACEMLFAALRKRLRVQSGNHVVINTTAGFVLNIEPSRDGQDHIQYNGGRLHPLPA